MLSFELPEPHCKNVAKRARKFCGLLLAASFVLVSSFETRAFDDPLTSPAVQVPAAARSLLLDVALTGSRIVAVGERGHIVYSDDNAKTWKQADVPVRVMLTAVTFPEQGATGWAVGHQGVILVTHDGGLSWSKQLDGYQAHQLMVDAYSSAMEAKANELESADEVDRPRIQEELSNLEFMLDDSLSFVNEGPVRPFIDVWFRNSKEGFAVGSFGLVVRTDDGGQNWYSPAASFKNVDARHYNAIDGSASALFLAGETGHVQRSFDGGQSWEAIHSPYVGSYFDVVAQGTNVLLLGLRGNAFISEDNGETWSTVETPTNANLSKGRILEDGRYLVSQYAPRLLVSNVAKTALSTLPLTTEGAISSFLIAESGSIITVGTKGAMTHSAQSFSLEVK